jgi:carbonic anhydrase/acetyltransferase-like protein (isoleucine patch superfamily)
MDPSPHALLLPYQGIRPEIDPTAFLAPGAVVVGRVMIAARASIWFGAVVRGDVNRIVIGERSNVQDVCVLHVTETTPLVIGPAVTVGHAAILHGCTIEEGALIGMGARVLDGARIGAGAMVGAGALVPPGMEIPPGVLALGTPARVARALRDEEKARLAVSADHYVVYAEEYRCAGIGKLT